MQFMAPFVVKKGNRFAPVVAFVLSMCVLVVLLSQTVFAQNTYVITDGDQVTVYNSYAVDPDKVLDEAGIRLDEDDFYTTYETEGGSEIVLQRAQTISIDYCGDRIQVNSYGEPLEQLLKRTGLNYDGTYSVSQPLDASTYDGMEITIDKVIERQETYAEEIPYETTYCWDDTLPVGQEEIVVAGVPGQKLCTADVTYVNSVETVREVHGEEILSQPVNQIIAQGTGKNVAEDRSEPLIGDGVIVLPTGEVLTYTRTDQYLATAYTHMDDGCDMTTATGSTVRHGVVAVDPSVIPYGTRMFIVTNDGYCIYGISTAEDCGSGINGKRLDLYMDNLDAAYQFGRRSCTVYFLGDANWR